MTQEFAATVQFEQESLQEEEKENLQQIHMCSEQYRPSSRSPRNSDSQRMEPLNNPTTTPVVLVPSSQPSAETMRFYQMNRPSQLALESDTNGETYMMNPSPKHFYSNFNGGAPSPMMPSPQHFYRYDSPRHSVYNGYDNGSTSGVNVPQYSPMAAPPQTEEMWPATAGATAAATSQTTFSASTNTYVYPTYPPYSYAVDPNWQAYSPRSYAPMMQSPSGVPQYYEGGYANYPAQPYYSNSYYPTPVPEESSTHRHPPAPAVPEQYYPSVQSEPVNFSAAADDHAMTGASVVSSSAASRETGLDSSSSKPQFKIRRRKDPSAPKNPKSAYLFFLTEQRALVSAEDDTRDFTDFAKELGAKWRNLSDEEKKPYFELARKDKERYLGEKAAYGNRKVFVPSSD
jgi:hypothetical protein